MSTDTETTCQGEWGYPRELGETGIHVQTCSGCRERWALAANPGGHSMSSLGTFPPGTPDVDIIQAAIAARRRRFEEG